ncbi:MAG: peptidoglycan DD-metalloendopeptidase family protein [Anaerovoracaceae bacterium]
MAKFFKEDLDKKENRNKPGSLIQDLENLGNEKNGDDFLKGFPKTPAEIRAEEDLKRKKEEAAARSKALQEQIDAEENEKACQEAFSEASKQAAVTNEKVEAVESREVKTAAEKRETRISRIFDSFLDGFAKIHGGIGSFFLAFGGMGESLFESMKEELKASCTSVSMGCAWLKKSLTYKMDTYYAENPDKKWERHQKNRRLMRRFITAKNNFIEREKEAAKKMVRFINRMDDKNDEIADKTNIIVKKGNRKFNFAREWAEINKKRLLFIFASAVVVAIFCVSVFNYCTAYEYAYNGRTLGMVKKQEDVLRIVDILSEQLSKEHNAEISIDRDEDITFKRVFAVNKNIDDTEQVLKRLTYMRNMNAKGYAIYVGDTRAAIVDSKETAKSILEAVKSVYITDSENVNYEKVSIKEDVKIKQVETKLGRLQNIDDVMQKLLTGAVYKQVHTVAAGETFSGIAKAYGLTISELREANPAVTPEKLSIGQELILTKPAPMVTVETVEVATYIAPIPHETEYQDSASLYKGETSTKVKGVDGEKEVTARIVRENGVQVASTELAATVLSEPTTEVVIRGTKPVPPKQGTGKLIYPVSGYRLTSKFGPRWGRMHSGIDMACSTGTRISAADGGTVIFAGYSGSYGYVVKINHGGNMVTVYAHCSKLFVKKGDRVFQGQHIANVGSTGRSTGPHLHFEVQINGTAKNPFNYLP